MPRISQISSQKRKKDRFNVFIDGKFSFSISAENLIKYKINLNRSISKQEIQNIQKTEERNMLLNDALSFLSFRPRSEKEVNDFLIRKISKKEGLKFQEIKNSLPVENTVNFLKKHNFLNDLEFSKWLIDIRKKNKGKKAIRVELLKKGVKRDSAENLLNYKESISDAYKLIEKKLPRWNKLSQPQKQKKIYNYLAYRGFSYETIQRIFAKIHKKG